MNSSSFRKDTSENSFYIENEAGSSTSLCLLISLLLVLALEANWDTLLSELDFVYKISITASIGIFVFFSILLGFYSVFSGEKSTRQLKREVIKESRKLDILVNEADTAIKNLEKQLRIATGIMTPTGFKELNKLKAMIHSIQSRSHRTKSLLKSKDHDQVVEAYNVFFSNIGENEDAVNSLILDDNLEPCSYEQIPKELSKSIRIVEESLPKRRTVNVNMA